MTSVAGELRVEGRPAAGQDVLAFDPSDWSLLATAVTDDAGRFRLDVDPRPDTVDVLAKVRAEVVTAVSRRVSASEDWLEVDVGGAFAELDVRVTSHVGYPEELTVFLDPLRLDGVPEHLMPFIKQRAEGVFEGRFLQRAVTGRSVSLRVGAGQWRIGAESINPETRSLRQPPRNYVAEVVQVDATGDREVTLVLRELAEDEL